MVGFSVGLGSLVDGLSQGMKIGQEFNKLDAERKAKKLVVGATSEATTAREKDIMSAIKPMQNADGSTTYGVGDRQYSDMGQARSSAAEQVGSVMKYYQTVTVPKLIAGYLELGQPEKAKTLQDWVDTDEASQVTKKWARAARMITLGDIPSATRQLGKLYEEMTPGAKFLGLEEAEGGRWRANFKNAEGEAFSKEFENREQFLETGLGLTAPHEYALQKREGVVIGNRLVDKKTGREMASVPMPRQPKVVGRGDGGADMLVFDPNTGEFVSGAATNTATMVGENPPESGAGLPLPEVGNDRISAITANTESGNRDFAPDGSLLTSRAGARGRMQVLDSTNADPGYGVRPAANNSPEERARVGRDYIAALRNNYDGDMRRAWGAYVWGPGKLDAALAAHGENWLENAPAEVRDYVSKNMAALNEQSAPAGVPQAATQAPNPLAVYSTSGRPAKPPESKPHRMTAAEVQAEGLDPATVYYRDKDGMPQAVSGQRAKPEAGKPWPATALQGYATNRAATRNLDNALSLLDPANRSPESQAAKRAVGFGTGMLSDQFTQWNDPDGVEFRSLIGQIGGLIIKDISGAAVSLSEDERLRKWVPYVSDNADTVRKKLQNLKREIEQRNQTMSEVYGPDQGYREFSLEGQGEAPAQPTGWGKARKVR